MKQIFWFLLSQFLVYPPSLWLQLTFLTSPNPDQTRPNPIFDQKSHVNRQKIVFSHFTSKTSLVWPQDPSRKIRLEILHRMVLISSNLVIWVRFYDHFTVKKSRFILLCRPSLHSYCAKLRKKSSYLAYLSVLAISYDDHVHIVHHHYI